MAIKGSEAVRCKIKIFNIQNLATYIEGSEAVRKKKKISIFKIWRHLSKKGSEAVR